MPPFISPPNDSKVFVSIETAREAYRLTETWLRLWDEQSETHIETLPDGRTVEHIARLKGTPEQEDKLRSRTHNAMLCCINWLLQKRWASDEHPFFYLDRLECDTPERTAAVLRLYRTAYDVYANEVTRARPAWKPREAWQVLRDAWDAAGLVLGTADRTESESTGGTAQAQRPSKAPRLRAVTDVDTPYLILDDEPYSAEAVAVHYIAALIEANGSQVAFTRWRKSHPEFEGSVSTRVLDKLPECILAFVERSKGSPSRLKIELLEIPAQ